MLENFIFENHLGQRFEGLANGVYINNNDLRDYQWSFDTTNSRISRFYRTTTSRKLPLAVVCKTGDEAVKVKDRLLELAEVDIEAMKPGKVIVGDYYTTGYITASVKSDYMVNRRFCKISLTLTSEDPMWYREQTHSFFPGSGGDVGFGEGTDYPYDYSYDYATSKNANRIICDSVRDNAFKLRIYGEITNPAVTIAGNVYAVNGSISAGETLLIDSLNKTITLTTAAGNQINWFDKRNREHYIFKPIPPGQNVVGRNGDFGIDLTVIEKRSEPKWT
jgi:hypothetical protein